MGGLVALTGCVLCRLAGFTGPCPHHAPAAADDVSPGNGEWPHFPGETPRGERRTLTADEALDAVDRMLITSERVEIEHRWT